MEAEFARLPVCRMRMVQPGHGGGEVVGARGDTIADRRHGRVPRVTTPKSYHPSRRALELVALKVAPLLRRFCRVEEVEQLIA